MLDRRPEPEEFLLYPEKTGPEFYGGPVGVIWQDRAITDFSAEPTI